MDRAKGKGRLGLRIIGAMKLVSALLLGAAGFGIFRLLDVDLGEALEHFVSRLHLDPENRVVHEALSRLAGIDRRHLEALGAGTFFYALLHLIEGTGLILRRRWAEYLAILATGSLLPLEVYEIARKPTAIRVGVLLVNLGILVYLIGRLWQDHRGQTSGDHAPDGRSGRPSSSIRIPGPDPGNLPDAPLPCRGEGGDGPAPIACDLQGEGRSSSSPS